MCYDDTPGWCMQVDVLDVDLNVFIETDLHLLTVVVIQLGSAPSQYVYSFLFSFFLLLF